MTATTLRGLFRGLGMSVMVASLSACSGNGPTAAPPAPANLSGSYVFTVTGTDATDGDYAVAGSFVTDGKGKITSGIADYNLGSGVDSSVPLTGSYTVSGSTATVSLTDSGGVQDTFTVALGSGAQAIQGFDGTGSGSLFPQVLAGFTPAGAYAFTVKGEGQGTVTGSGQLVVGTTGTFTGGILSYQDGMTLTSYPSVTGFLTQPLGTGRGQAALVGINLSYYVISPTQIVMLGLDDRALLVLPAQKPS